MAASVTGNCASCTLVAAEVGISDKTGTMFTASMHIMTAMIGVGVLAMPKALADLGWIAGPICVFIFYAVSVMGALALASVFEVDGEQHSRYYQAVEHILGRKAAVVAALCQLSNIFLVCIAFSITAGISMTAIADLACNMPPPEIEQGDDGCFNKQWKFIIIFGASQTLLVQVRSIDSSWLVSALGAGAAFIYCGIALGLGIGKVTEQHGGTVGGISYSPAGKAFAVLNALGSIGFAYGFSQIFLEVQDTIREPPKAESTMKKACNIALLFAFVGYLSVSVIGYLAFGNEVPDNILTAFSTPEWLVIVAHAFVLINMVASYNIFAQTFFLSLEGYIGRMFGILHPAEEAVLEAAARAVAAAGGSTSAAKVATVNIAAVPEDGSAQKEQVADGHKSIPAQEMVQQELSTAWSGSVIRAVASFPEGSKASVRSIAGPFRMSTGLQGVQTKERKRDWRLVLLSTFIRIAYVVITTVIALCLPFFGAITGVIGSLVFWPLAIYFPFTMYMKVHKSSAGKTWLMYVVMIFMLLIAVAATVGSVRNIIVGWEDFELFA